MGEEGAGHQALSSRLSSFRKWVYNSGCKVHSAVCIVNGEAMDGTRNAPMLILGPPAPLSAPANPVSTAKGRCGLVDTMRITSCMIGRLGVRFERQVGDEGGLLPCSSSTNWGSVSMPFTDILKLSGQFQTVSKCPETALKLPGNGVETTATAQAQAP
jgi:hypothetical protein